MHQDFFQTDCRGSFSKTSGFNSMDCGIHENSNEYLQIVPHLFQPDKS